MRHLKKFENFTEEDKIEYNDIEYVEDDDCDTCGYEEEEDEEDEVDLDDEIHKPEDPLTLEKKKNSKKLMSYAQSGLKSPKKADLNKDKKISEYEKKRGKAIEKSIEKNKK
jgi:hypothetical protein